MVAAVRYNMVETKKDAKMTMLWKDYRVMSLDYRVRLDVKSYSMLYRQSTDEWRGMWNMKK